MSLPGSILNMIFFSFWRNVSSFSRAKHHTGLLSLAMPDALHNNIDHQFRDPQIVRAAGVNFPVGLD